MTSRSSRRPTQRSQCASRADVAPNDEESEAENHGRGISHPGASRHHRRRHRRLQHGLSSGAAGLERRGAARAAAADLRHDLARRRPRRPAARHLQHDAACAIQRRALPRPRGGDRQRHRLPPDRLARRRRRRGAFRGAEARRLDGAFLRPRRRGAEPGGSRGALDAAQHRGSRRRHLPADRRQDQPGRHRAGPRQGRTHARRPHLRERDGHRHKPQRRQGHRRRDQPRRHRRGICRAVRRHVVASSRPPRRRQRAAPRRRAFLRRQRADRRAAPRPADLARSQRHDLRQGGCRQAARRLLRAGRQALGHGRHSGELLLRPAPRRSRSYRADAEPRRASHPRSRRDRAAALLQRSRELHAGRPLPSRRGAGAEEFLSRHRLQLGRHPILRRRRQGAGGMDRRRPSTDGSLGRRYPPRHALPEQRALSP